MRAVAKEDVFWEVIDENVKYKEEHESSYINFDLHNVYSLLYKKYTKIKSPIDNINNDIVDDATNINNITSKFKDYFIFLGPYQKITDSYDLTGFNILGGNFTFELTTDNLQDSVKTISLKDNKVINHLLPAKINNYKLYEGKIKKNSVSVNFESLKK